MYIFAILHKTVNLIFFTQVYQQKTVSKESSNIYF